MVLADCIDNLIRCVFRINRDLNSIRYQGSIPDYTWSYRIHAYALARDIVTFFFFVFIIYSGLPCGLFHVCFHLFTLKSTGLHTNGCDKYCRAK